MFKSKTVVIAGMIASIAVPAYSADEAIVRKLIEVSDIKVAIQREIRLVGKSMGNDRLERFAGAVDYQKIEDAYADSLAKSLTNQDAQALISAYEIPGYAVAIKKQSKGAMALISAIAAETKKAAKSLDSKDNASDAQIKPRRAN